MDLALRKAQEDYTESYLLTEGLKLERELNAANENTRRLHDCLETAWGIIANVSGGDWTRQKPEWQEAVIRWRDNQFDPIMKELSERRAKENK
jgi:hypothetical protein